LGGGINVGKQKRRKNSNWERVKRHRKPLSVLKELTSTTRVERTVIKTPNSKKLWGWKDNKALTVWGGGGGVGGLVGKKNRKSGRTSGGESADGKENQG